MRSIIILVVLLMLCVSVQGADVQVRGSVQVVVTTNASVALVPETGQTTVYQTGDDGYYKKGVTNPVPRFTILAETNQVLDNLTGLVWARDANIGGTMNWSNAIEYCESLVYGGTNDWRLPNISELLSLVDRGQSNPCLPLGHPFTNVLLDTYRSSSTFASNPNLAWIMDMNDGLAGGGFKTALYYVWSVRGGR